MTLRARLELEDSFASTLSCTICGASALSVVHLKAFPDYVTCAACGSAFVMEAGGERVMYGSISPDYPETRDFALKQWTSPEAIGALAEAERPGSQSANHGGPQEALRSLNPAADAAPAAPVVAQPAEAQAVSAAEAKPAAQAEPISEAGPTEGAGGTAEVEAPEHELAEPEPAAEPFDWPAPTSEELEPSEPRSADAPFTWPPAAAEPEPAMALEPATPREPAAEFEPTLDSRTAETAADEAEPTPAPEAEAAQPPPFEESLEPTPGRRFRVRYLGTDAQIPSGACAHCLRGSPKRTLVAIGAAIGTGGQPKRQAFTLPLCSDCYRRARARSEEERGARLMAHLTSILVAVVVMVGALALGVVPLDSPLIAIALLGVLAIGGYGIPAWLLLGRAALFPKPEDALFVRSTVLVSAHPQAGETLFDWRSPGFASHFQQANAGECGATIFEVADPLAVREAPSDESAT